MLTRLLRVVVLLSAFSFPFFAQGQTRNATPSVAWNEASASTHLTESSVSSRDLSASLSKRVPDINLHKGGMLLGTECRSAVSIDT